MYVDFPLYFAWNQSRKEWKARQRNVATIGRVVTVHPLAGDVFYLRMLLHHTVSEGAKY